MEFDYEYYQIDREQKLMNLVLDYSSEFSKKIMNKNKARLYLLERIAIKTDKQKQQRRLREISEWQSEYNAHLGDGTVFV